MSDWTPVAFSDFAGLDLVSSADSAGCIDLLNVDFDVRGAIRTRDGYDNFTTSELTNQPDNLLSFYRTSAANQLIAGCNNRLEAIAVDGTVVASQATTSGGFNFVRFGTPTAERVYAGNGSETLYRWTGSAWSQPTATVNGAATQPMPKGYALAVDSDSNRLVVAGFSTTTGGPGAGVGSSSPSHVYWSEPGDPETWLTDNSIQLRPGDGEFIWALACWNGMVFAFKETAYFVFYGESTDATGGPVFNYRPIITGVGVPSNRCVTVGPDGVYFLDRTGVYRTTGGDPVRVSAAIDPFFLGGENSFYGSDTLNHANIGQTVMTWHRNRLYISVPTGASSTNDRTLVYDPLTRQWTMWDLPAAGLASFRIGNEAELVFSYPTGANHVGRQASAYTSDDGSAIAWRYRTGFYDLGVDDEKRTRRMTVWGTGTVSLKMSRDFGSLDTARSLTLGTSPAIDRATTVCGKDGMVFSHQFSGSGQASVHRAELDFMPKRSPGSQTP